MYIHRFIILRRRHAAIWLTCGNVTEAESDSGRVTPSDALDVNYLPNCFIDARCDNSLLL